MTALTDTRTIKTPRLVLRPLREADAEPLFALFANWEIVRWLDAPPWPYALADAQEFLAQLPSPNADLADTGIAITRDDALIGGMDARTQAAGPMQSAPGLHIGYWIGQPYWGNGYMTEAAGGLIEFLLARRAEKAI